MSDQGLEKKPGILIIDDDPGIGRTLSDILNLEGYLPIVALTGKEGIARVKNKDISLALIDLKLPDMPGINVLKEIKKISPEIEIIILTGYASLDSAIDAINLGVFSYIQKPYEPKELIIAIKRALEKRKIEEALYDEKERFQSLIERSPLGVSMIDKNSCYKYINPKFIEMFGYTLEDIPTGKEWFKKTCPNPEYRKEVISTWINDLKKAKHGEARPRTFTVKCKDGSKKVIYFRPVTIGKGDQFVTYEDTTERKKAEEKYMNQLKSLVKIGNEMRMNLELEKLLQNICETITKALGWRQVILSLRDYEKGTSQPFAVAGYDEKKAQEILSNSPISIEAAKRFLRDEFKISESYYIDHTHWEEMKKYPGELVITPARNPKPDGWDEKDVLLIPIQSSEQILGFISPDNPIDGERPTYRKIQALEIFANQAAIAIENARLYAELRDERNRIEFYIDLMGHDINNLNQGVIGYLELLLLMHDFPDKFTRYVKIALDQVQRSANLIQNVKKLSALQKGKTELKTIDVYPHFKQAVENVRRSFSSKDIKINSNIVKEKYFVRANELMVDVFSNLLNNAVKYDKHDIVKIDIEISENEKYWRIEFKDRGPGIRDIQKELIFKRLERLDRSIRGSGVGLTLVDYILKSYNGKIWVDDRVKEDTTQGSNFIVLLPRETKEI